MYDRLERGGGWTERERASERHRLFFPLSFSVGGKEKERGGGLMKCPVAATLVATGVWLLDIYVFSFFPLPFF